MDDNRFGDFDDDKLTYDSPASQATGPRKLAPSDKLAMLLKNIVNGAMSYNTKHGREKGRLVLQTLFRKTWNGSR